ncbi:hypothetical protein jhhlp_005960 [Lomentospora prolificans]|uniref:CBM1 domain-containing protein n=1 Tax=Lomentospora prolificans TaxID=41688 RepID=A0A2N3N4K9_9PEZI|nr:hypothetical protein jhhlp_005960 [Lomentospora prolificans]
MVHSALFASILFALGASAQVQSRWGQCGGEDYDGPAICPETYYCTAGNRWYSQCVPLPGSPDDTAIRNAPDTPLQTTSFQTVVTITVIAEQTVIPSVVTTYITFITPEPTPPALSRSSPTPRSTQGPPRGRPKAKDEKREPLPAPAQAGDPTPSQLQDGQLWIRAVTAPHFHDYLQTNPQNEPGVAILGPKGSAGQYNIVDGQLISGGSADKLYLHVEKPDDLTQRKLATWFNTTQNEFGTFEFNGDAVVWSTPEVRRENLAAWLACEENALFINTGAYAYNTPAGCSDHTIHFYNGATTD